MLRWQGQSFNSYSDTPHGRCVTSTVLSKAIAHTFLNYHVLGTCTAVIFLSNGHSVYAPIYLGGTSCLISFVWDKFEAEIINFYKSLDGRRILINFRIKNIVYTLINIYALNTENAILDFFKCLKHGSRNMQQMAIIAKSHLTG